MVTTLTTAPTAPARTDDAATFVTRADAFVAWQEAFPAEMNALAAELVDAAGAAWKGTSTSSVAIGTGTKNFTTQTGLSFIGGMTVLISSDAAPATNNLIATVTSYNSGTGALVVSVASGGDTGSGTYADWSIAVTPSSATLAAYLLKSGGTLTGAVTTATPASGQEAIIIPHGSAPSAPTNGSVWTTTAGMFLRLNGTTYQVASNAAVQAIPIPATAMTRRTTNGPAVGTSETATNKVMIETLDFDQSTAEYAQIRFLMPKRWNEGTVTAQFYWTATTTGNVVWACQAVALSDDDVLDTAFGTVQTVTDGVTAANDLMISAATSAITIAGTPAAGDMVVFQFYRDASNGSDTLAADAKLLGVKLFITTDAGDDS